MKSLIRIGSLLLLLVSSLARADSFQVENIEVNGIRKITIGTVFSYLSVKVGDSFDIENSPRVIKELYATGFFDDIKLLRRDNVLLIQVKERPSIAEVNFDGNKDIKDEALKKSLDQVGMAKGRIFDQRRLDRMELELQQLYYAKGKYAARIKAAWRVIDEGRIAIDINISEGESAKIKSINITGNSDFDEQSLLDLFELQSSSDGFFPSDEYSSSKLSADLEALKSFYLDRGYLQFAAESQQVTISPDRKDISLSINLSEGEVYAISGIDVSGEMVVDASELKSLINFREGDIFSRKEINKVITAMQKRIGEEGYAFAQIKVLTDINETDHTVSVKFLVEPGHRMRVRYINFSGNSGTENVVLRREMRQFEGEVYQRSKVDRSRVRLQRLNYLGSVKVRLEKVADAEDQLDINVTVSERFSGNLQLGIGISQVQGVVLNLGFSHDNIFGTGKAVNFTFDNSAASQRYRFSFTDPYYTADGVSRGINFSLSKTDASQNNLSNFLIDRMSLSVNYGIPLSEFNTLNLELGIESNDFKSTLASSDEVFNFIINNNDRYDATTPHSSLSGDTYDNVFGAISFGMDTRNRRIFADSGHLNSIRLEVHSGDLDFYKLRYRHRSVYALSDTFVFSFKSTLGFGESYGASTDLPIFEKFTAGGVRSIRGYQFNSLGPLDSNNDPFGGDLQVITTGEVLFPLEFLGSSETFRLGLYLDAGNVFADAASFDAGELRQSVGLSAKWFSVIGPIEFSYAVPLNDQPGDRTRSFQFALGASF